MISNLQPDYYTGVYEFEELAKIEDREFNKFDDYLTRQLINLFVSKADEQGIEVFENEYNITTDTTKSLEDRRYQILTRLLPPQPITFPYFKNLLKIIGLKATMTVNAVKQSYKAVVDKANMNAEQINRLNQLIQTYLPADLAKEIYAYIYTKTTLNHYLGIANSTKIKAHADYKHEPFVVKSKFENYVGVANKLKLYAHTDSRKEISNGKTI
ncbi:DUF2313 domain-containing protein (plasmid) [Apilactobacillus apisilvae]|uniref:DUF2313 domain-containing protein n=1 Tax=Apilactobacillus apisilvae TaxID=2923364 RepID=A0ABY4PJK7_9LACO|nr:putative phage tail protein [Apilactobacillus apisilvae]UQS85825.1 DUF2313 domain-containing protein [Apilactobacillus apisilvae]